MNKCIIEGLVLIILSLITTAGLILIPAATIFELLIATSLAGAAVLAFALGAFLVLEGLR